MQREMPEAALHPRGQTKDPGPGVLKRQRGVRPALEQPAHPADFVRRHAVDLGHFANGRAEREAVLIGDHGRAGRSIAGEDEIQDAVPLVPREININVRRIVPAGIQEPLEEQIVPDRVHVGDPQAIRHNRGGSRSPAACPWRLLDDLVHDEKIVRVALLANDRQFTANALLDNLRERAVTPPRAGGGLLLQQGERLAVGQLPEGGEDRLLEVPVGPTGVGDSARVGEGVRDMGKLPLQCRERHEPLCRRAARVRREARQRGIERDGAQKTMERKVLGVEKMDTVGGHRRKSGPPAERQRLMHHGARRELLIEILR